MFVVSSYMFFLKILLYDSPLLLVAVVLFLSVICSQILDKTIQLHFIKTYHKQYHLNCIYDSYISRFK